MTDVFISYKSEDRAAVDKLVSALEADGLRVWWDQHIPANATWETSIERALENAKAVVVCWSRASVASENVKAEARRARQQGRLLQAFLDDCEPPLFFGERQGVNLRNWDGARDRDYTTLVEGLRDVISGKKPSAEVGYIPRRSALGPLFAVAGVTAALVIAGFVAFGGTRAPTIDAPSAPNAQEVFARIFDPNPTNGSAVLGGDIRYLESLTGPPSHSYEDPSGTTTYAYMVGACEVTAVVAGASSDFQGTSATSVVSIGARIPSLVDGAYQGPDCDFDLGRFFRLDHPLPATSTIAEIEAALPLDAYFTTDCPHLTGCGNAFDPSTYFIGSAPHAWQYLSVEIAFYPSDTSAWLGEIASEKGEAYLDGQFVCDPANNNSYELASRIFGAERPFSVSIGYQFPYPGPLRSRSACEAQTPSSTEANPTTE